MSSEVRSYWRDYTLRGPAFLRFGSALSDSAISEILSLSCVAGCSCTPSGSRFDPLCQGGRWIKSRPRWGARAASHTEGTQYLDYRRIRGCGTPQKILPPVRPHLKPAIYQLRHPKISSDWHRSRVPQTTNNRLIDAWNVTLETLNYLVIPALSMYSHPPALPAPSLKVGGCGVRQGSGQPHGVCNRSLEPPRSRLQDPRGRYAPLQADCRKDHPRHRNHYGAGEKRTEKNIV